MQQSGDQIAGMPETANDTIPAGVNNDAGVQEALPTIVLTPEIEAGLLALAPLIEIVQARKRSRRTVGQRVHALPERPEMTPEERQAIRQMLERKGFR